MAADGSANNNDEQAEFWRKKFGLVYRTVPTQPFKPSRNARRGYKAKGRRRLK